MTHIADFKKVLEYYFPHSQFKVQKTLPLFPITSPNTIKGSISKVEQKSQGVGYYSDFYKVICNSRLTEFDSRYRSLNDSIIGADLKSDPIPIPCSMSDQQSIKQIYEPLSVVYYSAPLLFTYADYPANHRLVLMRFNCTLPEDITIDSVILTITPTSTIPIVNENPPMQLGVDQVDEAGPCVADDGGFVGSDIPFTDFSWVDNVPIEFDITDAFETLIARSGFTNKYARIRLLSANVAPYRFEIDSTSTLTVNYTTLENPFWIQIVEEKEHENRKWFEYTFEVRYAL